MAGIATLEQPIRFTEPEFFEEQLVFVVPELEQDVEARRRASALIGAVATEAWNGAGAPEETADAESITSLYEAIPAAAKGNKTALRMVEANVGTDVNERAIKAGHIIEIKMMADSSGVIRQHSQSQESIQANSLRFASDSPQMRDRTKAETRNSFRLSQHYSEGTLEDYYFGVISRAADNMSVKAMDEVGFFTDTMSTSIQLTGANGNLLTTESAFVAGKATPEAPRHDKATIKGMCARLGIDIGAKDATELLDTPFLIHKSLLPNGVIDLVKLYDESAGGTFFGESKPAQDYLMYREKCREREAAFKPTVQAIVKELLAEADTITTPLMATQRLNKLSGKHLIALAGHDKTINSAVFGHEAAARIEVARWHYDQGNMDLAHELLQEAVKLDTSSSCPSGAANRKNNNGEAGGSDDSDGDEDRYGSLEFDCPKCKRTNRRPRNKLIPNCQKCKADVTC